MLIDRNLIFLEGLIDWLGVIENITLMKPCMVNGFHHR
jgi:hypothetical protein